MGLSVTRSTMRQIVTGRCSTGHSVTAVGQVQEQRAVCYIQAKVRWHTVPLQEGVNTWLVVSGYGSCKPPGAGQVVKYSHAVL